MINKQVANVKEALKGLTSGMTLMLGGFGLCGIPEHAIAEMVEMDIKELTCISNNAGVDDFGINSTCNSPDNICRSNSSFSPT